MKPLEMNIRPASPLKQISTDRIRLIVADLCPLIVHGLIKIIDEDDHAEVVAGANSFHELWNKIVEVPCEIALIDWDLLRSNPIDAPRLMKAASSHTRVTILIASESMHERRFALQLGARGIVRKRSTAKELLKAIWKVHRGGLSVEHTAAEALLEQTLSPDTAEYRKAERLTNREREVALLVCRGLTNKQISAELSISETTVWHHLTSVFGKLEVSGRVGLVNYAHQHLIAPAEQRTESIETRQTNEWIVIETPRIRLPRSSASVPA